MGNYSVADFEAFINQQIKIQEKIEAYLWRLEGLMTVAVRSENFYKISETSLHNYFMAASDLVEKAAKANWISLNALFEEQTITRAGP